MERSRDADPLGAAASDAGRDDGAAATFVAHEPLVAGALVTLGEDVAHHARVRRLDVGAAVELRDGAGRAGSGRLAKLAKRHVVIELTEVRDVAAPPPVHLLVPVGDRERMLWLAEKAVEIGVASWRPVLWRRSRSVGPRGEGSGFQQKVRARMAAALAQSGGAWLPDLYPDAAVERAIAALADGARVLLHPGGAPLVGMSLGSPVTLAFGPEGGFDRDEIGALTSAGFRSARLPGNILRFETAGVVGLALARALTDGASSPADPPAAPD